MPCSRLFGWDAVMVDGEANTFIQSKMVGDFYRGILEYETYHTWVSSRFWESSVAPLRAWYGGRHEEYLRPLLEDARKFGELIIGFHRDIEKFSKRTQALLDV